MNIEIARQRINEVIQVDTNTNTESDFLATHVPFRKIKIKNGGGKTDDFKYISEAEIFEKYIRDPGERHQFIVVQGASGSGKSHLIRWFATKFNTFKHENETVIYIRRSDNSLKGTIRQLLDLDEIRNLPNREIYKHLSDAGTSISSSELKNTIYYHLIAKVKSDADSGILSNIERKNLIALLSNQDFMENFLNGDSYDGPVDRIYRKVAPSDQLKGTNDKPARFEASDFVLSQDFVSAIQDSADRNAFRLAVKLWDTDSDDLPLMSKKIANYLNQFVDSVIQEIAGLQPGDFENVFSEIRRELFRQGKSLTLLIEDITSFTGVNQALLNVLTDTHTGTAAIPGKEMCRLSSVVGTTTEYYEEFRDNFANRISQEIFIEDDALTSESNSDSLIEFVAKYLNAMSLTGKELDEWAGKGAQIDEYPVADSSEPAFWDRYDMDDTHSLSLYPLNRNSIIRLTNALGDGRKTPRYILTDVIRRVAQDVLTDEKKFPSFSLNASLLNGMELKERNYMASQVEDKQDQARLLELMCIWGNSTIKDQKNDAGERFLAGIRYEIYETFGFHDVHGEAAGKIAPQTLRHFEKNKGTESSNNPAAEQPDPSENEETPALRELSDMLGGWVQGEPFLDGRNEIRRTLDDFVYSGIDWQSQGVSYENVGLVKKKYGLITVAHLNRANATGLFTIPASAESALVINASERWRLIGNRSWDYDGFSEDMYYLTKWLHDITPTMISLVRNYLNGRKNRLAESALSYTVYCALLNGQQMRTSDPTNLIADIRAYSSSRAVIGASHCASWAQLQGRLHRDPESEETIRVAQDYFNIKQDGGSSKVLFLNRSAYNAVANKLIRDGFAVEDLQEMLDQDNDVVAGRRKITASYKLVQDALHTVIEEEDHFSREVAGEVCDAFELDSVGELDLESLNEFFETLDGFMKAVKNADLSTCLQYIDVNRLRTLKDQKDRICMAARQLDNALNAASDFKKLVQYSANPCVILMTLKNLITGVKKSIKSFRDQSALDKNSSIDATQNTPLRKIQSAALEKAAEVEKEIREMESRTNA